MRLQKQWCCQSSSMGQQSSDKGPSLH
jgi:hypothetical protein